MRAVVQRVSKARVTIDEKEVARIDGGLLVYAGVGEKDGPADAEYLATKIRYLRVFPDAASKMNLDVVQAGGAVLVVSNFTLLADARQGRRPDFTKAEDPAAATKLYERMCALLEQAGLPVQTGKFGAMMCVEAVNDGPINILLDSKRLF
jgi:D-tyrosyl-tRNA(Tyr) deacylase